MRRRQILSSKGDDMSKSPNSNLVAGSPTTSARSNNEMFLPRESDIVRPNGTPFRKKGSKPGPGAYKKTITKNRY